MSCAPGNDRLCMFRDMQSDVTHKYHLLARPDTLKKILIVDLHVFWQDYNQLRMLGASLLEGSTPCIDTHTHRHTCPHMRAHTPANTLTIMP
jgi:hypothetical protein